VGIDARLVSGIYGGVEQFLIGLAFGLAQLDDGDEQYLFLAYENSVDWLRPYLGDNCRLLSDGSAPNVPRWKRRAKRLVPFARSAWHKWRLLSRMEPPRVLESSGTIERAGVEVMHFTKQSGFLTEVPSIYHPHDLQHLHLPEFFTPRNRRTRDAVYRILCTQADMVAVASCWVKRDLLSHYPLRQDKVQVVPLAAPLQAYPEPSQADLSRTSSNLGLPDSFLFYPAQTWPHKNHIELLRALAYARDRLGLRIHLVCSGQTTRYLREIETFVARSRLVDQVKFVGFVSALELKCLYRLCRAVVIPTRFEAGSFPMMEAFSLGTPVACSNVTSLPEQAGDAAVIFDPADHVEMAKAILSIWSNLDLRRTLSERGRRRQQAFSWGKTARLFRAYYRHIGDAPLSDEDHELLSLDPCRDS
jgi:glycosyltransferase involved in cell wall biosynthesis